VAREPSTSGSSSSISASTGFTSSVQLDMDGIIEIIRSSGAKIVGLQAPEGLKRALPNMAREISDKIGAEVIISGDPCYGACDIDLDLGKEVDLVIHLGHAELGEGPDKFIYFEASMPGDLKDAVGNSIPLLKGRRIGIATTVQHVHKLKEALKVLQDHDIQGVIGPACGRARYPGQVLGCFFGTVKGLDVEEYLFLGTGRFHPLGIALSTGKRVVASDPVTGEVAEIDPDPMLRRRWGAIARAMDSKKIAVIVSKKPGQRRWETARKVIDLGKAKGRDMMLVYLDNIEPDRLLNLGVDAAVSTACPRIALDDTAKYSVPVLTPQEFEIVIGYRRGEDYEPDECL
jgi:2-(3-amino-3-carboxypropyl)histidine synthase